MFLLLANIFESLNESQDRREGKQDGFMDMRKKERKNEGSGHTS
jgi:hypothetical protein